MPLRTHATRSHDHQGAPLASLRGFQAPGATVDLDVHAGDIVLVRGANGSGKTSLLRALAGLPQPCALGSARLLGQDPATTSAAVLRDRVGYLGQDAREGLVGLTTEGEFRLRGAGVPDALRAWAERPLAELSSGEARAVALQAASVRAPSLLLLDEPEEGLDSVHQHDLAAIVLAQARRGAVVLADHGDTLPRLATRTLELGTPPTVAQPRLPAPGPHGTEVAFAACTVRRGDLPVRLPSIRVRAGLVAVTGPNGSGKSTLLEAMAGLHGPGANVDGAPAVPGRNVRLLLPRGRELLWRDTVGDEVGADGPLVDASWLDRPTAWLSGGEAQRVAISKSLRPGARCYLLDEPEAHLDEAGRAALLSLVAQRVSEGACVLAATHDPAFVALAHARVELGA